MIKIIDQWVHAFPKGISPNVKTKFEPTYFSATVHHVSD